MKNIVKKILAFLLIIGLLGQTSVSAYEELTATDAVVDVIEESYKIDIINNIKGGEKLIKQIDEFIKKINIEKAKKLKIKLTNYKNKLDSKKILSKKDKKLLLLINYIIYKTDYKIEMEEISTKLLKQADFLKKFDNKLSDADNKKVNEQLVKIQNNLLNKGVDFYENILGELEDYTNYEEKGNFTASVNFDHKSFGKSSFELKLKDYFAKNSGFDTQLKTKIEAVLEAAPKGQEEVKVKVSALVDYILKDQNYYLLLKDLKIIDEKGISEIKEFVEKAKEIAKKNKYIHYEDKNATQVLQVLKELNPDNILKQGKTIASKPLFKAYKKEGTKYFLVPSKYGCDTAKTLAKKFDPFNGSSCTDSQYQDLLKDIADSKVEFYIDFSDKKKTIIGFNANKASSDIEKNEGFISFSDKYIDEIKYTITPNQEKYPNEGANIEFIKAKKLDIKLFADKGKVTFNLKSTLDPANRFKTIDFKADLDKDFVGELTLNKRKISGKYTGKSYNSKYVGIITGKTDTNNVVSNFKITNQYINSSSYNSGETNTVLEYNNGTYSINNKYVGKGFKSDLDFSIKIPRNTITEAKLVLDVYKKDYSYDDNYELVYSDDFKKVFESNIELKNKNLNGKTIFSIAGKEYIEITNTGRIEEDKIDIKTNIDLKKTGVEMFMSGFDPLGNYGEVNKVDANLNVKTDTTSTKNNINIYFDLNVGDDKIMEIELDNKSRKVYKKTKILAPLPNDTIEAEKVFSNPELY